MSQEDLSVSAPAEEEPHGTLQQTPQIEHSPSTMNEPPTSPYTQLPLPPVPSNAIRIMFNNTNSLQTGTPALLANTMNNYVEHDPTILGLMETKRNWRIADKASKLLLHIASALQGENKARVKLATASCRESHTADDIYQPGGVAQLTMNRILNLHKTSGSGDLGRWTWQEFRLDGTRSLILM